MRLNADCSLATLQLWTRHTTTAYSVRRYGIPDSEFSSDAIRGKCRDTNNHCFHTSYEYHSTKETQTQFAIVANDLHNRTSIIVLIRLVCWLSSIKICVYIWNGNSARVYSIRIHIIHFPSKEAARRFGGRGEFQLILNCWHWALALVFASQAKIHSNGTLFRYGLMARSDDHLSTFDIHSACQCMRCDITSIFPLRQLTLKHVVCRMELYQTQNTRAAHRI